MSEIGVLGLRLITLFSIVFSTFVCSLHHETFIQGTNLISHLLLGFEAYNSNLGSTSSQL